MASCNFGGLSCLVVVVVVVVVVVDIVHCAGQLMMPQRGHFALAKISSQSRDRLARCQLNNHNNNWLTQMANCAPPKQIWPMIRSWRRAHNSGSRSQHTTQSWAMLLLGPQCGAGWRCCGPARAMARRLRQKQPTESLEQLRPTLSSLASPAGARRLVEMSH